MAEKGFELKVLIPTDDGVNISEVGIEKSKYYLTYNLSNRSYQLAEKFKTAALFQSSEAFNERSIRKWMNENNIDLILEKKKSDFIQALPIELVNDLEISDILNRYIDVLDKKSAN